MRLDNQPTKVTIHSAHTFEFNGGAMLPLPHTEGLPMDARWKFLEDHADREEVQAAIQHEIQIGTIRVVPGPRGIRIIPQIVELSTARPLIDLPTKLVGGR